MRLRVGTSGYSYKEWKGSFYPEKIAAKEMLRYYGERLSTVEINNTFYRLPRPSVLENWAEQVSEEFRFVLKASRRITHFKRLKDVGEETGYFLQTARVLDRKLGVLLFQFPPNFRKEIGRLDAFLEILPDGTRAALEFRNRTWIDDDVLKRLRSRNLALCVADTGADGPTELIGTADWGYLRLRRPDYTDADLSDWVARVRSQAWTDAFVFFKHEDAGAGPRMASRFLELAEQG